MLKETLDKIIEKKDITEVNLNYDNPTIAVLEDDNGNPYVFYIDDKGNFLYVLDDNIKDYQLFDRGLKVNSKTFLMYFDEIFKEMENLTYQRFQEKADSLFKEGRKEEYIDFMKKFVDAIEQTKDKTSEEYLSLMMDEYEKEMRARGVMPEELAVYNIDCDIAQDDGPDRPRGGKTPSNTREKPEFAKRFEDIEKITGCKKPFLVNNGQYTVYDYDLKNNENGETGYMMFLEPENIDFNGAGTIVGRLSLEEFDKIKKDLEKQQEEKGISRRINDVEVKGEYVKKVLEDLDERAKTKPIRHRGGHYEEFLKRIEYYATGNKTLAKQPYLREYRDKIVTGEDKGER